MDHLSSGMIISFDLISGFSLPIMGRKAENMNLYLVLLTVNSCQDRQHVLLQWVFFFSFFSLYGFYASLPPPFLSTPFGTECWRPSVRPTSSWNEWQWGYLFANMGICKHRLAGTQGAEGTKRGPMTFQGSPCWGSRRPPAGWEAPSPSPLVRKTQTFEEQSWDTADTSLPVLKATMGGTVFLHCLCSRPWLSFLLRAAQFRRFECTDVRPCPSENESGNN